MDSGGRVLELRLDYQGNEFGATTVREYMAQTLRLYYQQGYQFDGKYAFEGHWDRPIVWALADADLIEGTWEHDDGRRFSFEQADPEEAKRLIHQAFDYLMFP
jgi:hypothetical protein